ncbi:MAG: hypothetical protein M5U19_15535 [Microthrixaceae bacterium]|nr:hypothetical protein [Microthrixaceae bacterium]
MSGADTEPNDDGSREPDPQTHRGAFGEYGGETGAFIERTFRERILLVGVDLPPHDSEALDASLDELSLLVDTAGADEVGRVMQRRDAPDPATYVGRGKVSEIRELAEATDCDTVVFDDELTPRTAEQPDQGARPFCDRPHCCDPRHLRPERPQPGGQGAGATRPVPLPAAPAPRQGP